jgi:hypothetical protein
MKVTKCEFLDGIQAKKHRKENNFQEEYLGLIVKDGEIFNAINCRFYGTQAKNYCCLWFNNGEKWASGSGSSGGYGYHRPSAAAEEALRSAGVQLTEHISGRGDSAIKDSLMSLLEYLYPGDVIRSIVKAHP